MISFAVNHSKVRFFEGSSRSVLGAIQTVEETANHSQEAATFKQWENFTELEADAFSEKDFSREVYDGEHKRNGLEISWGSYLARANTECKNCRSIASRCDQE